MAVDTKRALELADCLDDMRDMMPAWAIGESAAQPAPSARWQRQEFTE